MVGNTVHQSQQTPQLARSLSASSSTAPITTAEEDEFLKRNTDCVYYLASPLTCKKGSECEYRHSDIARVNPRDCWYWLNGNCLNPKCAFRHPPLDGLLESDVSTPMGPPVPEPHANSYAMPKQGVACIFFQKGFCLKGPLCPFMHGPSSYVHNKPTKPGPANPVTKPPKTAQQVTGPKPVEFLSSQRKQPPLPIRNGVDKKIAPGSNASNKERVVNGKDADRFSREFSPGFDVLVDDEREDDGHGYHVDRDTFLEHREYDRYNERGDHFDVENLEKRSYPRIESNDRENGSDLRHRLSKQRRGPAQETLNSRFSGRIKIPRRSMSPSKEKNLRVEREIDIERRHLSLNQSHARDRISESNFSGPKRLSELKGVRTEHQLNDEQFLGKRRYQKMDQDLSFEGPKPLSEILKRKRGVKDNTVANDNGVSSASIGNKKGTEIIPANEEEHKSVKYSENEEEGEGGLVDEDALLDEEIEAYDENRDGDYEYEQMDDEEDYNLDEGEYIEEEDEYGKKEGVVYS